MGHLLMLSRLAEDAHLDAVQVLAALPRLRPLHVEALRVRYDAELTYREVAQRLGVSLHTAAARVRRALHALRTAATVPTDVLLSARSRSILASLDPAAEADPIGVARLYSCQQIRRVRRCGTLALAEIMRAVAAAGGTLRCGCPGACRSAEATP